MPNSPFFTIRYSKIVGRTDHFIVNSIDGKFYGSNDLVGISKVMERYVLPLSGSVLFVGRSNMGTKSGLGSNNLVTGKTWSANDIFTWKMIEHRVAGAPLEVSKTEVLIPMESALYSINSETGELNWRTYISVFAADAFGPTSAGGGGTATQSTGGSVGSSGNSMTASKPVGDESVEVSARLFKHPSKRIVYLINPNGLTAYNIDTGKEIWKRIRKANIQSEPIFLDEGIIVCTDKIYLYDYETGDIIYKKPQKFGGEIHLYDFIDNGIVLGIHKLDRKQQSYYEMNILNPETGQLVFEESFETNGLLTEIWPCKAGVFYTTDRALGVWNKTSGKDAFPPVAATTKKRNIFNYDSQQPGYVEPANGSLLTVFRGASAYVYNTEDHHLYKVDTESGTKTQLTKTPLSVKTPNQIESRENGVLISSSQTITLIGYDGNIIYTNNYEAPGYTLLARIVALAAIVYDHQRQQQDPMRRDQLEYKVESKINESLRQNGINRFQASGTKIQVNVEGAQNVLKERFELSKKSQDYYFINTQLATQGNDGKNEFGLLMVNKNNGEVEKVFPFGQNRAPQFTIDEVSQKMFYLEGDKLHCYQL